MGTIRLNANVITSIALPLRPLDLVVVGVLIVMSTFDSNELTEFYTRAQRGAGAFHPFLFVFSHNVLTPPSMITPVFEVSQNGEYIIITLRVPHIKVFIKPTCSLRTTHLDSTPTLKRCATRCTARTPHNPKHTTP